ncbi:MAG: 3-isopropylmalate dehydratase large subunit [Desulfurococcales archaeon]|nr:3-isopropylmalate dehydratase large subunit [Desulfurococcales archaeon]
MVEARTLTLKMLESRLGRSVETGEIIVAPVDLVYMHDGTFPLALQTLREAGLEDEPWDPGRVLLFIDHAAPAPTVAAATVHLSMRRWARKRGVRLYDVGSGISHQVVAEEAHARPGMIVVGADSHTITVGALAALATGVGSTDAALAMVTGRIWLRVPDQVKVGFYGELGELATGKDVALQILSEAGGDGMLYKSIEFQGSGLKALDVSDRLTIANMAVEMGAKYGLFPSDNVLRAWLAERGIEAPLLEPDPGAWYSDEMSVDLSRVEPMVAEPPGPYNARPVSEFEGIEVDQVFIGSCTNGRYEDLVQAARILKGRRVRDGVRCIAVPASRRVYKRLLDEGIIGILSEAGCTVSHSTCGPCLGAHFGLLGPGEVAVSTSNRNFPGRMGHKESLVYLASPYTAAAAAVTGELTDPRSITGVN